MKELDLLNMQHTLVFTLDGEGVMSYEGEVFAIESRRKLLFCEGWHACSRKHPNLIDGIVVLH